MPESFDAMQSRLLAEIPPGRYRFEPSGAYAHASVPRSGRALLRWASVAAAVRPMHGAAFPDLVRAEAVRRGWGGYFLGLDAVRVDELYRWAEARLAELDGAYRADCGHYGPITMPEIRRPKAT